MHRQACQEFFDCIPVGGQLSYDASAGRPVHAFETRIPKGNHIASCCVAENRFEGASVEQKLSSRGAQVLGVPGRASRTILTGSSFKDDNQHRTLHLGFDS